MTACQCESLYILRNRKHSTAPVAQLVERRSHNPEVVSSILIWGIDFGYGVPIGILRGNHAELVHNIRLMVCAPSVRAGSPLLSSVCSLAARFWP